MIRFIPGRGLKVLLINKKVHFCARLKVGSWKVARQLVGSGKREIISEICPSKASKKKQTKNTKVNKFDPHINSTHDSDLTQTMESFN